MILGNKSKRIILEVLTLALASVFLLKAHAQQKVEELGNKGKVAGVEERSVLIHRSKEELLWKGERWENWFVEEVEDRTARNGKCLWLCNKINSWGLLRWYWDDWSVPFVSYKLYVRVRINKTGNGGKVFSCGVYDQNIRKNITGTKAFLTREVEDSGWHEYFVGQFLPEKGQYAFITTEGNANAPDIYVDDFYFVPVLSETAVDEYRHRYLALQQKRVEKKKKEEQRMAAWRSIFKPAEGSRLGGRFLFGVYNGTPASYVTGIGQPTGWKIKPPIEGGYTTWQDDIKRRVRKLKQSYMDTIMCPSSYQRYERFYQDYEGELRYLESQNMYLIGPSFLQVNRHGKTGMDDKEWKDFEREVEMVEKKSKYKSHLCYYLSDEPEKDKVEYLLQTRELIKRKTGKTSICVYNTLTTMRMMKPYENIVSMDPYLIRKKDHQAPWHIWHWLKVARKDRKDVIIIAIPQAFGGGTRYSFVLPSNEQIRLQTYLYIVGGAKGIIYFSYESWPYWHQHWSDENTGRADGIHLTDCFGVGSEQWEEIRRISGIIVPLFPLLATSVFERDLTGQIECARIQASVKQIPAFYGSILKDTKRDCLYIAVVNNDLENGQALSLKVDQYLNGKNLYDLLAREKVKLGSNNTLRAKIGPAGLGLFAICDGDKYQLLLQEMASELFYRESEIIRLKLERLKDWGLKVHKYERKFMELLKSTERPKNYSARIVYLKSLGDQLERVKGSDTGLTKALDRLDNIKQKLHEINWIFRENADYDVRKVLSDKWQLGKEPHKSHVATAHILSKEYFKLLGKVDRGEYKGSHIEESFKNLEKNVNEFYDAIKGQQIIKSG